MKSWSAGGQRWSLFLLLVTAAAPAQWLLVGAAPPGTPASATTPAAILQQAAKKDRWPRAEVAQPAVRSAAHGLGATIGSPANLLSPDRYEFYTFDETGDLVRRHMTLDEIKSLLAGADGDLADTPIATFYHGPVASISEALPHVAARDPEDAFVDAVKGVEDVVNNVQNVLKMQLAASKHKIPSYIPAPRPPVHHNTAPDATAAWSMLLPTIMENAVASTTTPVQAAVSLYTRTPSTTFKPVELVEKPIRTPTKPLMKPIKIQEKPVERTTTKPVFQEKPVERTTTRPVYQERPVERTTFRPAFQEKPVERTTLRPATQEKPVEKPTTKPIFQDSPMERTTVKPALQERPIERTTPKPVFQERPVEKTTKPVYQDKLLERTTTKPVFEDKPLEETSTKPVERTTAKPVSQDKPVDRTTTKPMASTRPSSLKATTKPPAKPVTKPSLKLGAKPTYKPAVRPSAQNVSQTPLRQPVPPAQLKEEVRPVQRPKPVSQRPMTAVPTRPYTLPTVEHTTAGNPSEEMNKLSLLYTLVSSSPSAVFQPKFPSSNHTTQPMIPPSFPSRTTTTSTTTTSTTTTSTTTSPASSSPKPTTPDPVNEGGQFKRPISTQNQSKPPISAQNPSLKPVELKVPEQSWMVKVPTIQRPHPSGFTQTYFSSTSKPTTTLELKQTPPTESYSTNPATSTVMSDESTVIPHSTAPLNTSAVTTEIPPFTTTFYVSVNKDPIRDKTEDKLEIKSSDFELSTTKIATTESPTTVKPSPPPYSRPPIIQKVNFTNVLTEKRNPSTTTTSSWVTFKTDPTTLTDTTEPTSTMPITTPSVSSSTVLHQALLTKVPASMFLQKLQLKTEVPTTTTNEYEATELSYNRTAATFPPPTPTEPSTQNDLPKTTYITESPTDTPTEPYTKSYLKISSVTLPKKEWTTNRPVVTTDQITEQPKVTVTTSTTQTDFSTIEPKIVTTYHPNEAFVTVPLFESGTVSSQVSVSTDGTTQSSKLTGSIKSGEHEPATQHESGLKSESTQQNMIESRTEGMINFDAETDPIQASTIQDMVSTEQTTITDEPNDPSTPTEGGTTLKVNELFPTTSSSPFTTIVSISKGSVEAVTYAPKQDANLVDKPSSWSDRVTNVETTTLKVEKKNQEQNWTRISVVDQQKLMPPPQQENTYQSPSSVELHAAPHENLGLEASTTSIDPDIHGFVNLCNELAFQMWNSLKDDSVSSGRSLVLSPFSATSQLAMVFLGARGPTSGQMNDVLRLDDMVSFNPHQVMKNITESVLHSKNPGIATAALVRELYSDKNKGKLLDFYKERAQQFYDGHVEEIAFRQSGDTVRRRTNLLVKRQTFGKISEYMLGAMPLRPPLAAFSANILETECNGASTEGRDGEMHFVVTPAARQRRLVPVPAAVWRSGFLAGYEPALDATAVALGSPDAALSIVLILPGQQGHVAPGDGLSRLEQRLLEARAPSPAPAQRWGRLLRTLLPRPGLELQLPRFSHRSVVNMSSCLARMGLGQLFNRHQADLRGLNGFSNDLHLSDVIQLNTFSTCGERTSNARHHVEYYPKLPSVVSVRHRRKVTPRYLADFEDPSILEVPLALRPRQARIPDAPRLRFDRPFLFFVRHNPTGMILHMGRFNPHLLP